jgi:hypothetical protein
VGADQIGKAAFVGPQQERVKVHELLDALEADYRLRGKHSPQFRSHLKHIQNHFGAWRATDVTAEAIDGYVLQQQQAGLAAATVNRSTQLLAQAFKLQSNGSISHPCRRFGISPKRAMRGRVSSLTLSSTCSSSIYRSTCVILYGSAT